MRTSIHILSSALLTMSALGLAATPAQGAGGSQMSTPCAVVETVWAAGSGQDLGAGDQARWVSELDRLIMTSKVSVHHYELGQDKGSGGYGGHSYDPVDVDNIWNGNPLGAWAGSGYAFDYGKSVDTGVGELYNYLIQRTDKCGTAQFVLGGYSQGAQVVGQTMEKLNSERPSVARRILFSAHFGDPKLYLPEGKGVWPAACRGSKDNSAWRRLVPDCGTDEGSLGARVPYVPDFAKSQTGLWCNHDDFVCGASPIVTKTATHGEYKVESGPIAKAAVEIAEKLLSVLPADAASDLQAHLLPIAAGRAGLDVVFVIDTTGSMYSDIAAALELAKSSGSALHALGARLAVVAYRDAGDSYTAQVVQALTTSDSKFNAALASLLSVDGGGDTPEALLHALMTSFNSLDWTPGATKAAVVLTDANFHSPDEVDGTTTADVIRRSLEVDPVNVYPVVPDPLAETYRPLADATSGQVVPQTEGTATALVTALNKIQSRPVARLPLADYYGESAAEFTFDARQSSVIGAKITSYDWDFDGDGAFDLVDGGPLVQHSYGTAGDRLLQVRVRADNATVASASAKVHVGTPPPTVARPSAPSSLTASAVTGTAGAAALVWTASDSPAKWAIKVNDVVIGTRDGTVRDITLGDLPIGVSTDFAVAAISATNAVGSFTHVSLTLSSATPTPTSSGSTTPTPMSSVATPPIASPSAASPSSSNPPGGSLAATGGAWADLTLWAVGLLSLGTLLTVGSVRARRGRH